MADRSIVEYIVQNRGAYNNEALRGQLIAAGHDPTAIDEAFAELWQGEPLGGHARPTWSDSLGRRSFWVAFIGYAVAVVVVVGVYVIGLFPRELEILPPLMVVAVLTVGIVAVAMERLDPAIRRGIGCALAALASVPAILVAGILVNCLVALETGELVVNGVLPPWP